MRRDSFIDSSLIKMRGRLSEASENPENPPATPEGGAEHAAPLPPPQESVKDREWRKALDRRWDEFRLIKRDFTGRLTEGLAAIPEDIRVTERRLQELQNTLEKFASLLDEAKTLDDSKWNRDNFSADLGAAIRKMENIRLEYLRLSSRLAALQRESDAAENDSSGKSILHELNSLSPMQGFRLGLIFFLPLIIGLIAAAFILAVFIIISMR